MYIYEIINLINNKKYIGQTTLKKPIKRWKQHLAASKKEKSPLYRAMRKYGRENFKFKILEKCLLSKGNEREIFHISNENSLLPNGYNIEKGGKDYPRVHARTKKKISKSHQGRFVTKKSSSLTGVRYERNIDKFRCEIAKNRKKYIAAFSSEVKAGIAYDKIALYLYGSTAKINFEQKREKWLNSDLYTFFLNFLARKRVCTSMFNGVAWMKERGKWKGYIQTNKSKRIHLGYFNTELEAANIVDKAIVSYRISTERNFPKNIYSKEELLEVRKKKRQYSSKYEGVYYHKSYKNFFILSLVGEPYFFKGGFKNEKEAFTARKHLLKEVIDKKRKELQMEIEPW